MQSWGLREMFGILKGYIEWSNQVLKRLYSLIKSSDVCTDTRVTEKSGE